MCVCDRLFVFVSLVTDGHPSNQLHFTKCQLGVVVSRLHALHKIVTGGLERRMNTRMDGWMDDVIDGCMAARLNEG